MPKVLKNEFADDLTYVVDYIVEAETYNPWKAKLTNQILSNVEVPGFRKGKAPAELALKNVNVAAVEDTIFQETISKYGSEAVKDIKENLAKEDRIIQSQTVDTDPEHTVETAEGFKFRIMLNLLPKVDLSGLEKLKKPEIKVEDMPERLSKESFVSREENKFLAGLNSYAESTEAVEKFDKVTVDLTEEVKDSEPRELKDVSYTLGTDELPEDFQSNLIGLKLDEDKEFSIKVPTSTGKKTSSVKYKVKVKKILKPTYTNLDELFEKTENAKKQFENKEKLQEFLANYYDQETKVIEEDLQRKQLIQDTLKVVPDFSLPEDRMEAEQNRILKTLQQQAESTGQSLGEIFLSSGISDTKGKVIDDGVEIKNKINDYVKKEFKWVFILRTIYELKIEDKITTEQLETVAHEMEKKPDEYNIRKNAEHEYYHEIAFDRLMRSKGASWLFDRVLGKQEVEVEAN